MGIDLSQIMGCGVQRGRVHVMGVSQRFLSNPSPSLRPHLRKCTIYLVTSEELKFLSKLFTDLSSRSGNGELDRLTFLQFFPLPVRSSQGLWGERLFEKFDAKGKGRVGFEDFIKGISICVRGTEEELLRFLFSLYDLKGDGLLDRSELVSMMHNTYKCTMLPPEDSEEGQTIKETQAFSPRGSVLTTDMSRRLDRGLTALIKRDDFGTKERVEMSVEKIMKDLDAEEGLRFEHFGEFVMRYPKILEVFVGTFKEDMWKSPNAEEMFERKKTGKQKPTKKRCLSCFCPTNLGTVHISHATRSSTVVVSSQSSQKTGWLSLSSKDNIKVFAVLRGNMLLAYSNSAVAMPNSVIFLEGCFIEELDEPGKKGKYGFEVSHMFEGFRKVSFWTTSDDDRVEWVNRLRQAAKARKVSEFYEFLDLIGTGKFSEVYKGVEIATNLYWAIKVIEKKKLSDQEREMMRSEVAIMRLLNHSNVVQMKEVFEDKQKMYLITELVEGGELFDRIKTKKVFSEYTAFHVTRQLLEVVKYLHDVGIVHRDIKPENILLTDSSEIPTIKLADFGLSKLIGPTDLLRTACGTLGYVAPEILLRQPYGKPVDLWSAGTVSYLMLRGRLPFDSKDRHILIQKAIECDLDMSGPFWERYTPYATDFLRKMIEKDQDLRLTVEQALSHTWIRKGDILIPRKINKKVVQSENYRTTMTGEMLQGSIYCENPKERMLGAENQGPRMVFTTPDLIEDMEVSRRGAEQTLAVQL